jgi:alpha-beta hydrolase superfamily lysophospholipase
MKNLLLLLSFLFTTTLFAQEQKIRYSAITDNIVAHLKAGQYDSIVTYFDSTMKSGMDAKRLEETINGLTQIYGNIETVREGVIEEINMHWMSRTPVKFAKSNMVLSLTFDSTGKVAGMFISPQTATYIIPSYVKSLSFLETKMDFGTEGWKVNGTLTFPRDNEKHPVVIIVHGSGPMDKEGTTGNSKIYRDLAWGLATQGIAVFRYDKRSFTHGSRLFMETYQGKTYTPQDEVINDVLDAIKLMSTNSHVDPSQIYIVGHSQGGMLAPEIAKQSGKLAGVIMLAANARPLQEMILEQMSYLYDGQSLSYKEYEKVQRLKHQAEFAKKKKLDPKTPTDSLPFNVSAAYWNYLNAYDQVKVFTRLTLPVMVLQGERDYQVNMTDYNLWMKAAEKRKGKTMFKSYPKLNHLFIAGEGRSVPAEYQIQGNMNEEVILDIANWIKNPK